MLVLFGAAMVSFGAIIVSYSFAWISLHELPLERRPIAAFDYPVRSFWAGGILLLAGIGSLFWAKWYLGLLGIVGGWAEVLASGVIWHRHYFPGMPPSMKREVEAYQRQVMQVIDGLGEVHRLLFATLLDRYKRMFPSESEETIRHRAGVVSVVLIHGQLRGPLVQFRTDNLEFVEREKNEALLCETVRRGVATYLVANGALRRQDEEAREALGQRPPLEAKATTDSLVNEAVRIEPAIAVPDTVEGAQETLDRFAAWFRQHVGETPPLGT